MRSRRVVIDPDGTAQSYVGVIIEHATGVVYEQQCAGIETAQRTVEGYFVPLGGCRFDPEAGNVGFEELRAPFHKRRGCHFGGTPSLESPDKPRLPPERIAQLKAAVEMITYWGPGDGSQDQQRTHLRLDESRLRELVEAWVPVITPDGPGILTWPNCD